MKKLSGTRHDLNTPSSAVHLKARRESTSTPRRLDTAIRQKDRQERFLASFVLSGSILHACRATKIHRQTHYYWLRVDPTYAARFEQGRHLAVQTLEDEAVRRAVEGIRRPVIHNGVQVVANVNGVREPLWENEYSDTLLMFLLKALAPHKYNPPRETINLLELDPDLLTSAQLDKLLDHLIVKMVGNDPEAIEAARRDLAAGPIDILTPIRQLRDVVAQLQELSAWIEQKRQSVVESGRDNIDLIADRLSNILSPFAA